MEIEGSEEAGSRGSEEIAENEQKNDSFGGKILLKGTVFLQRKTKEILRFCIARIRFSRYNDKKDR